MPRIFRHPGGMLIPGRLRTVRKRRGLTVEALAERIGVHKGHLSRIERGEKTPSLGTLMALSKALDTEIGELFGEKVGDEDVVIVRRGDRQSLPGDAQYGVEVVLPAAATRPLAAYVIEPGPEFLAHDLPDHAGFECLVVLKGAIELQVADRLVSIGEGDCAAFDGRLAHRLRRLPGRRAMVLVTIARDVDAR